MNPVHHDVRSGDVVATFGRFRVWQTTSPGAVDDGFEDFTVTESTVFGEELVKDSIRTKQAAIAFAKGLDDAEKGRAREGARAQRQAQEERQAEARAKSEREAASRSKAERDRAVVAARKLLADEDARARRLEEARSLLAAWDAEQGK